MKALRKPIAALLAALPLAAHADETKLAPVVVTAPTADTQAAAPAPQDLAAQRARSSDTASLLSGVPGVYVQGAGGVSGLPTVHGVGDDRLRLQVDGMDLVSACANHMNPPLSYIDPNRVGGVKVYAGVTPVSAGGDSIGATVQVDSAAPEFAAPGQGTLVKGQAGAFYRSNGHAHGGNVSATAAGEQLSVSYSGAVAQSGNYHSAKDFKAGGQQTGTIAGNHWLGGDEVGSSAYKTENHALDVALRSANHLLDLKLGYQHIPYQGFPNQHMDMTGNWSRQANLGYVGTYAWGTLEARVYHEETRHSMDFGPDKYYYTLGMPMDTQGNNSGARIKADIPLSARDLLRVGGEYQRYRLNDWWRPVGTGGMSPDTFINIKDGGRDRYDLFAEWEAQWSPRWQTLLGMRGDTVSMNTGAVQGYKNNTTGSATYDADRNAFNAKDRQRTDNNVDLTASARFTPDSGVAYEGGYSRKTRSPSLYERYTWSTGSMAMTMNNWVNDGNGYVGNIDLKPEVAHTLSLAADWHDAAQREWGARIAPYYSLVDNYIDATCALNKPGNTCTAGRFNYLTLVNQDARLYGIDISGFQQVSKGSGLGDVTARGVIAYVRGKNLTTGDNLYNIMPLNAKATIEQKIGNWTNAVEVLLVSAKKDLSAVRNEMKTAGYGLLNLRASYETKRLRVDLGLENALDKQYSLPLGGAYIGQGRTMSLNGTGAPWGITVPGMGRSLYTAITVKF